MRLADIAETSAPAFRGRLLTLLATAIAVAQMLVELLDLELPPPSENAESWRVLVGMMAVFPLLLGTLLLAMPNAPSLTGEAESQPLKMPTGASGSGGTSGTVHPTVSRLFVLLTTLVVAKEGNGGNVRAY